MKKIRDAFNEELQHINDRSKGLIHSMKTPWKNINAAGIDGLEWGSISTFAAMSGGGKTAMLNELVTTVHDCNPGDDIAVLFFSMEMAARKLIGRTISHETKRTVKDIYLKSTQEDIDFFKSTIMPRFVNRDINYIEVPKTVERTAKQIRLFLQNRPNKQCLIAYDHSLLVKRSVGAGERDTLIALLSEFNKLKKEFPNSQYILLTQLNRDIENIQRINDSTGRLHFPKKGDIFGSDASYQFSDIVAVIHDPFKLGIRSYGPKKWPTKGFIFGHLLKVREGAPNVVVVFKNELKFNRLTELTKKELLDNNFT